MHEVSMNDNMVKREDAVSSHLSVKAAYEEAGRNYRYFLSWRERLLAGYLALLAGLSLAFSWLLEEAAELAWTPFAAGFFLTLVIWALEFRNRDLYRVCQQSAKACESHLPQGAGMFTKMGSQEPMVYHSTTFNILFSVVAVAMLACVIWSVCRY
jgi:hypothetical protein